MRRALTRMNRLGRVQLEVWGFGSWHRRMGSRSYALGHKAAFSETKGKICVFFLEMT